MFGKKKFLKNKIEMQRKIESLEIDVRDLRNQVNKKDEKIIYALDALITENLSGFVKVNGKLYRVMVTNLNHDIQQYCDSINIDCVVI